jgi:ribose 5-phosphate isomerase B
MIMEKEMRIIIGCDLAGYDFKMELIEVLRRKGYDITDAGCESSKEGDYPVYARTVGENVVAGKYERGILICGTGQGVCMAANKVKGVRAALCYDVLPAIMSREHNNSNVLATGAWIVTIDQAVRVIEAWLFAKYSGGRHEVRIQQMAEMEKAR